MRQVLWVLGVTALVACGSGSGGTSGGTNGGTNGGGGGCQSGCSSTQTCVAEVCCDNTQVCAGTCCPNGYFCNTDSYGHKSCVP
jgi:hypothetical protein